ncbi:hypothetical protein M8J75_016340 [Diaphorina citri]|nr:hypothetical protein M8J75_016340 [Diaphorina citri]
MCSLSDSELFKDLCHWAVQRKNEFFKCGVISARVTLILAAETDDLTRVNECSNLTSQSQDKKLPGVGGLII